MVEPLGRGIGCRWLYSRDTLHALQQSEVAASTSPHMAKSAMFRPSGKPSAAFIMKPSR